MTTYAHITGWGMAVPEKILTNNDISKMVNTSDEWIKERTGIEQRRIAGPEDSTASLASAAALEALKVANVSPRDVDQIIVATSSPQHIFPATASLVQDEIGAINAGGFDILAACTGFIFALNIGTLLIKGGENKIVLVIGSETLSKFVDWSDRGTCIIFGDGAGAFVLQANNKPGGVISSVMRSDGSGGDLLSIPAGGSAHPASPRTIREGLHYIQMNGREVYRFATKVMARSTEEVLAKANWDLNDISLLIPHQANKRIINAAARGLKLSMDKIMVNVQKYGNTSTASIPIATVEAIESGRLNRDDKLIFVGFGGGLTWGALSVIWKGPFPTEKAVPFKRLTFIARLLSWYRRLLRRLEGLIWGRKDPSP